MSKKFSLGIDLGTSNSALALSSAETGETEILPVSQVTGAHAVGEHPTLASAIYLPSEGEFPPDSLRLPWPAETDQGIVGNLAREHGVLVPDRLVTSAKSWLCNLHVDRKAPILPWNSKVVPDKISPWEASRRYLNHLKCAFLSVAEKRPVDDPCDLGGTKVVVTVPASFDEVARNLTQEAAHSAGLDDITLIEEPIAAFYSWLDKTGSEWRQQTKPGDIILICDVGGGTADFSLIAVSEIDGDLTLDRISVGEHILLGGDNMDLALAYAVRGQTEAEGKSLDDWQFLSLILSCRMAKERLFSDSSLDSIPIAVPKRGSGLFAGTVSTQLDRITLNAITLDGFIPLTMVTDLPRKRASIGLQEFGLAYESDPVLSKHLAQFLTRSLENVLSNEELKSRFSSDPETLGGTCLKPNAVLFNGGVFKAEHLRKRILDLLASWNDGKQPKELVGTELDLAVARGAAYYGRQLITGEGVRVKAGTARSYYLGMETAMPAIPGFIPPVKALCVVRQGMEEGTEEVLEGQEFGLVTGEPVEFRFFNSSIRAGDTVGQVLLDAERELEETSRLKVALPPAEGFAEGEIVPVKLHARVTELGSLELWMHHTRSDQKWKLEFTVRTE